MNRVIFPSIQFLRSQSIPFAFGGKTLVLCSWYSSHQVFCLCCSEHSTRRVNNFQGYYIRFLRSEYCTRFAFKLTLHFILRGSVADVAWIVDRSQKYAITFWSVYGCFTIGWTGKIFIRHGQAISPLYDASSWTLTQQYIKNKAVHDLQEPARTCKNMQNTALKPFTVQLYMQNTSFNKYVIWWHGVLAFSFHLHPW